MNLNRELVSSEELRFGKSRYWNYTRFFVAIVLFLAAGLKVHQLATVPSLGEEILHARWFNIFVVEFELLFGVWLIFGMLPRLTWLVSIGLFSIFAVVSFYKAISGETSCGCFGNVTINPWITTAFDLGVVGLLGIFRPKEKFSCRVPKRLLLLYCGFCVLLGVVVYCWISQMTFERLEQVGQILEGNTVQLEPEKWVGKEFPLRDYVIDGQDFMQGNWTILLVRPGCEYCDKAKIRLIQSAKENKFSVVLIDIASKISLPDINKNIRNDRLISEMTWVVDTPIVLELQDGVVRDVRNREQLIQSKMKIVF